MEYKLDFDDVWFNLSDFAQVGQLNKIPRFAEQSEELYRSVLEEALRFSKQEIAPLNEKGDRIGAQVVNGQVQMPTGFKEAFEKFCQNGFNGIDINPEWGGMGLPSTINIAASEFFMGACPSFTFFNLLSRGDCDLLQNFADDSQKSRYIPTMISGRWTGTMCLTEPQAGSAVGDLSTTAKKNPDGSYQIQGTKIFITCGSHNIAENIIHLVLARIEGDPAGTKGISLFIVPEKKIREDGSAGEKNDVKLVSIEHKMGIKASPTCLLQFGDENNCQGFLLGEACEGMRYMFHLMNEARLATGQQGVAIGATAYEHALQYAKERTQSGKTLIVEYPDVRRMLMTQKAYVEALRCLTYDTGIMIDTAWHHPDEKVREEYEDYAGLLTPVCKAFGSDMGFRVTELAIQVYGGYGYIQDYPVEQYMRDLKIASLYEGTNGIQAMDLIGRKFLRNHGVVLKKYLEKISSQLQGLGSNIAKELAPFILKRIESFAKAAQHIAEQSKNNADYIGLSATPFLRALGDIVCAQLLLRRAALAEKKLSEEKAAERVTFLQSKIEVAKFYVHQLLPEADLNMQRILSNDMSALQKVL